MRRLHFSSCKSHHFATFWSINRQNEQLSGGSVREPPDAGQNEDAHRMRNPAGVRGVTGNWEEDVVGRSGCLGGG
jgi:hypothetical protein